MATAEQYAQWIVSNADKKGTPEFDTVSQAYQAAKAQETGPTAPVGTDQMGFPTNAQGQVLLPGAEGGPLEPAPNIHTAQPGEFTPKGFNLPELATQTGKEIKGLGYGAASGAAGLVQMLVPGFIGGPFKNADEYLGKLQNDLLAKAEDTGASGTAIRVGEFEGAGLAAGGTIMGLGKLAKSVGRLEITPQTGIAAGAAKQVMSEALKDPKVYFAIDAAANAAGGITYESVKNTSGNDMAAAVASTLAAIVGGAAASKAMDADLLRQLHNDNVTNAVAQVLKGDMQRGELSPDNVNEMVHAYTQATGQVNLAASLKSPRLTALQDSLAETPQLEPQYNEWEAQLKHLVSDSSVALTDGIVSPQGMQDVTTSVQNVVTTRLSNALDLETRMLNNLPDRHSASMAFQEGMFNARDAVLKSISGDFVIPEGSISLKTLNSTRIDGQPVSTALSDLIDTGLASKEAKAAFENTEAHRKIKATVSELDQGRNVSYKALFSLRSGMLDAAASARRNGLNKEAGALEKASQYVHELLLNSGNRDVLNNARMWGEAKRTFDAGILAKRLVEDSRSGGFQKDNSTFWQILRDPRSKDQVDKALEMADTLAPGEVDAGAVRAQAKNTFTSILVNNADDPERITQVNLNSFLRQYGPSIKAWGMYDDFSKLGPVIARVKQYRSQLTEFDRGENLLQKYSIPDFAGQYASIVKQGNWNKTMDTTLKLVPQINRKLVKKTLAQKAYRELTGKAIADGDVKKALEISRTYSSAITGLDPVLKTKTEKLWEQLVPAPKATSRQFESMPKELRDAVQGMNAEELKQRIVRSALERITRVMLKTVRIGYFSSQYFKNKSAQQKMFELMNTKEGINTLLKASKADPRFTGYLRQYFNTIQMFKVYGQQQQQETQSTPDTMQMAGLLGLAGAADLVGIQ